MDVCYRHPDRETGVACSNCGRPICPECMTSTPVGMRCPECARKRQQVRTATTLTNEPTLTYVLIGINVLVFLGGAFSGASATGGGFGGSLINDGSISRLAIDDGEYYRLLTAGFLHSGLFHLLFNMFALYVLGSLLEPAIGRWRFGLIYFVSLLAGSFGALLVTDNPVQQTVGASGAIFGLLGAAVVVMRNRGMNAMESGLGMWLLLNLFITFAVPGISIGGHIGGLIGGTVAALVLFDLRDRVRTLPPVIPSLIVVMLGAASVLGAIAVSTPA
jgi:membrane associated rhomboid family serine protease